MTTTRPISMPRSKGLLTEEELRARRAAGIPVAFDPAQAGWVEQDAPDDVDLGTTAAGRTPAVTLRPWSAADLFRYTALLDDPQVWATLTEPYPDPLTPEIAEQLIALSNNAGHHCVRAVIAGGRPVGQVRLQDVTGPGGERVTELSYWIGRAHWGRGHASAAVALMLRHQPVRGRLIARARDDNAASLRLLDRAGFAPVGPDPKRPGWRVLEHRSE